MNSSIQKKNHLKLIALLVLLAAIVSIIALYFGVMQRSKAVVAVARDIKINGVFLPEATNIPDFKVTDNKGKIFTKENFKGRWTLLFFGFTNCGYVCPTTLVELNKMYQTLELDLAENELPQVVLITVDPERDTQQRMDDFIKQFNTKFIGARAASDETDGLIRQFHISAVKMQADGESSAQYSINHSAEILLINPQAKVQAYFSYPQKGDSLAREYRLILKTLS